MQIQNAIITGSFSYNGADLSNVTSSNAYSASLSSRTTNLESTSSVLVGASASFSSILSSVSSSQQQLSSSFLTLTASFNAVSASQQQISASYIALSASYNVFSGSASTRITVDSASLLQVSSSQQQISSSLLNVISIFATTGSNSFRANQSITGSLVVSSTITAQTLVVQTVTSSIVYSSGSNIFGCDLNSRQTFTGSVLITGSLTIAGASSATSYSGTTIYGSTAVCSPVGKFTSCIDAGYGYFTGANSTDVVSISAATAKLRFQPYSVSCESQILAEPIGGGSYSPLTFVGSIVKLFAYTGTEQIQLWTSNTERMRITCTGYVGIGTCTPTDKLHILGADNGITICSITANRPVLSFINGSCTMLKLSANATYGAIADNTGNDIMFFKNCNIGIGTSSPSGTGITLNVKGVIGNTTSMAIAESQDAGSMVSLYSGSGSGDHPSLIYLKDLRFGSGNKDTSAYVERMRITSCGKVGIIATDPKWLLEICCNTTATGGGGYPAISINNPNDAGYSAYYFHKGSTNMGALELSNATCHLFVNTLCTFAIQTSGTERMRITSTGVTKPYQPAFQVYACGDNQVITNSSVTKINFHLTRYDVGSNLISDAGRFRAPFCGRYLFTSQVRFDTSSGSSYMRLLFSLNGSTDNFTYGHVIAGPGGYSTNYQSLSISAVLNLAVGDCITVLGGLDTGTTNRHNESQFSGYFLG